MISSISETEKQQPVPSPFHNTPTVSAASTPRQYRGTSGRSTHGPDDPVNYLTNSQSHYHNFEEVADHEIEISDAQLIAGLSQMSWSPDGQTKTFTKLQLPKIGFKEIPDRIIPFRYIQTLDLSNNSLTDISKLSEMKYLVHLDLSGNRLTKPPEFPMGSLISLDLSRNQIMSIPSLAGLKRLKTLCLDKNLIKKISGLEDCKELTFLSLRQNGITKIEGLSGLLLQVLDLKQNRIRDMENLESLTQLQELNLANNYITNLTLAGPHPHLRVLDLEGNDISSLEEVKDLRKFPLLANLSVKRNPIESQHHTVAIPPVDQFSTAPYITRLLLIHHIPQLLILDNMQITAEERVRAENAIEPPESIQQAHQHHLELHRQLRQYTRIKAIDLQFAKRFRPIVLAGPAGVGKRTLTQRLLREFPHLLGLCVSHTTRDPRPGEENGVHYHFVKKQEMLEMIENGQFVEVVSFFGNWYGNSFDSIDKVALDGKICIMDLELEGVLALKRSHFSPRFIYITAPSYQVLQERLENRMTQQKQVIKDRKIQEKLRLELEKKQRQQTLAEQYSARRGIANPQAIIDHAPIGPTGHLNSDVQLLNNDVWQSGNSTPAQRSRAALNRDASERESQSSLSSSESDAEIDNLVAQWLDKAHKDTKQSSSTDAGQEALYAEYANEPGFFDAAIINDDFEKAYAELKDVVMKHFWETYDEDDE